jgi:AdoMet-dependent heme synthase
MNESTVNSTDHRTRWDQNPLIVIWEVTRACVLACRHCRAKAIYHRDPRELSTDEAKHFIDQVVWAAPRIFILTGGDPIRRSDLAYLIEYASSSGLHVAMSPSATPRFLKTDLGALGRAGLKRISLSLDGATSTTHNAFRGISEASIWTLAAIAKTRTAGIATQINTTFTRQNLHELENFVRILDAPRRRRNLSKRFSPHRNGKCARR